MNRYIPQLDGIRCLAVALVMFGHWTEHVPQLARLDYVLASSGVNLFFVLSGFLITGILLEAKSKAVEKGHAIRQFYIRRFLRIFPLYYGVLFVAVLAHAPGAREYFFSLVTYTANYPIAFRHGNYGYMTHLWSLAVEEQFYLIFPFVVLFVRKKYLKHIFILAIAAAIIFRALCFLMIDNETAGWMAYSFMPGCLDCLGLGALLAYYFRYDPRRIRMIISNKIFIFSAVVIWITACIIGTQYKIVDAVGTRFFFALVCFWIIAKVSSPGFSGIAEQILSGRVFAFVGKISYGIYVYHHFMPWIFERLHIHGASYLYLPTTILIAYLSWQFFERPINDLKNKFTYEDTLQHRREITA